LRKFNGYSACKSPDLLDESVRRLGILKLDANENVYGPSPKTQDVLSRMNDIHIYPDANQTELRCKIAEYCNVSPDNIIAGSGSDQLIDLLIRTFVREGDEVISFTPTFAMYRFYTELAGGKFVGIPRDDNYHIDLSEFEKYITDATRLIFVAMPNNPTGTQVSIDKVIEILETGLPVVIDEAYYEFTGQTVVPLMKDFPNLMILRTFSKWAGLAGLRVGYGIFPELVATQLDAVKDPYCVSTAGTKAAIASLEDLDYLKSNISLIVSERKRLFEGLTNISFIQPFPSEANFILCRLTGVDAGEVQSRLERRGILVRCFNTQDMRNCLRFSIGRPEDTDRLLAELRSLKDG
jgi:histidinol-phosphate aminotransferase